jgi:Spy/CpxP family protein refolding chaperone
MCFLAGNHTMNQKNTTAVVAGALLLVTISAYGFSALRSRNNEEVSAQKQLEARKSMAGPKFNPQEMIAELKLTEDQQKKVQAEQMSMMEEMKKLQALPKEERMKAMREAMNSRLASIQKILTKEQFEKMKANLPPMPGEGFAPPADMMPPVGGAQ